MGSRGTMQAKKNLERTIERSRAYTFAAYRAMDAMYARSCEEGVAAEARSAGGRGTHNPLVLEWGGLNLQG